MGTTLIERRKRDHLRLVLEREVSHPDTTLLEDVHLVHDALPELDYSDLDLTTSFFSKSLTAPLMITSMTGGAEHARRLNQGLARAARRAGIAFAVGSQRVMLRHPEVTGDFAVREEIGEGVLLGNIGAVQLVEVETARVVELVRSIEADGVCVHLNIAQELVQAEGNRSFRGLLDGIGRLVEALEGRVLVKETGAGLSKATLERLAALGVHAVDVAGAGGTSWTRVEAHREANGERRSIGDLYRGWGIPTAVSVANARQALGPEASVVASGGVENGLDAARAIALGADLAGFARPVLAAFQQGGEEGAVQYVQRFIEELKVAMVLTGSGTVARLQQAEYHVGGRLREWLATMNQQDGEKA